MAIKKITGSVCNRAGFYIIYKSEYNVKNTQKSRTVSAGRRYLKPSFTPKIFKIMLSFGSLCFKSCVNL